MKIDIVPIIEKANKTDSICIEMREIDALYVIRLANGKDYSCKWSRKEMEEFQPNKTVSQMIEEWENGIIRRYDVAKEALKSNLHPTDTIDRPIVIIAPNGMEYKSRNTERLRRELTTYERNYFKREVMDREKEFGKLSFFKIC